MRILRRTILRKNKNTLTGKYAIQTLREQVCPNCSSLEFCKTIDPTLLCGEWENHSFADSLEDALILASSIEKYDESCPEEQIRILTPNGQIL